MLVSLLDISVSLQQPLAYLTPASLSLQLHLGMLGPLLRLASFDVLPLQVALPQLRTLTRTV
jgi:hypothetical protein